MLKLENIKKDYDVADSKVHALRGIDLSFRKSEFVSILGPSGCGKTTLLNLIGGLDKSTSGDIKISGTSTKNFKDKDWDNYRNHRIGFVFQSYNLIPHQTVLGNVELALTIAGIDKQTRVSRAKEALDKVGLSDQYYKKPNQLSGGQSQRVAIARALVNDPEILLADEPTGALDTVTSKQIMEILKEISKEKLVIMVTHNPELADAYSNRIIRLLDGKLIDDTNPYEDKENNIKVVKSKEVSVKPTKQAKQAKMSFWTSFRLSLQNLISKRRRTIMTIIAGSIGIIGVSFVLAISFGLQGYIDNMQEDMLSGNPITIEKQSFDLSSMGDFSFDQTVTMVKQNGYVNVEEMVKELHARLSSMDNIFVQNTINKNYVDYINDLKITNPDSLAAVNYNYGIDVGTSFYTDFKIDSDDTLDRRASLSSITATYTSLLEQIPDFADYAEMIGSLQKPFSQAPNANGYIENQYTLQHGKIATEANEIMIVVNKNRAITDLTLAQLGYYTQEEFINIVYKAIGDDKYDETLYDGGIIDFETLVNKEFVWYPNDTIFNQTSETDIPFTYEPYEKSAWAGDGISLKVVGILEPKENINYGTLTSGFYYTEALALEIMNQNYNSLLATHLRDNMSEAYSGSAIIMRKGDEIETQIGDNTVTIPLTEDRIIVVSGQVISYEYEYVFEGNLEKAKALVGDENQFASLFSMTGSGNNQMPILITYSIQQLGGHADLNIIKDESGNDISWEVALYDNKPFFIPNSIYVYPADLKVKSEVIDYLNAWNSDEDITLSNGSVILKDEREQIIYSDILSLVMGMISSLIQVITIALIGFTSLALIVSSVMIGIITYVSVVERIKEIGVIRSLGGRKKDVSNLFMAETFIIGLSSGVFGIVITYLLGFIVNQIVGSVSVIPAIAVFPWYMALVMITISVLLTLVSGLMPSKSAAKKDPVVALRTE